MGAKGMLFWPFFTLLLYILYYIIQNVSYNTVKQIFSAVFSILFNGPNPVSRFATVLNSRETAWKSDFLTLFSDLS